MGWYPWTVPDEAVAFVEDRFYFYNIEFPPNKALDYIIAYVIDYVAQHNYFPQGGAEEALTRWKNPGLTEPEKETLFAEIEIIIKIKLGIRDVTWDQLHLACWASLMFCWSQEGLDHVLWWKRHEIGEAVRSKLP